MLRELVGIEAQLRRGVDLVNGLRVAIDEAKMGEPGEKGEGETIFWLYPGFPTNKLR